MSVLKWMMYENIKSNDIGKSSIVTFLSLEVITRDGLIINFILLNHSVLYSYINIPVNT